MPGSIPGSRSDDDDDNDDELLYRSRLEEGDWDLYDPALDAELEALYCDEDDDSDSDID